MTTLPAPPVPHECDCRGLPYMPLHVVRLRDSDLTALATGDQFKAAVLLWCASWQQMPAASLPNEERILARLAGLTLDEWRPLSEMALHGWRLCSDGRLYHPVIAEAALEAWGQRPSSRTRGAAGAAAKWPPPPTMGPAAGAATRSQRLAAARAKGTHTEFEWEALKAVCGPACLRCKKEGKLARDHIEAIYLGGSDAIENIQPLCIPCNSAKGPECIDYRPPDWLERMQRILNAPKNASERMRAGSDAWQEKGKIREQEVPLNSSLRSESNGAENHFEEFERDGDIDDAGAWAMVISVLVDQGGLSDRRARSFVGKLRKDFGLSNFELAKIAVGARASGTRSPEPYLTASAKAAVERRGQANGRGRVVEEPGYWSVEIQRKWLVELRVRPLSWRPERGPAPGLTGCKVERSLLAEFGFEPDDGARAFE